MIRSLATRLSIFALMVIAIRVDTRAADETGTPAIQPYRVHVRVVFDDDPRLTDRIRNAAMLQLESRIRAVFGASWQARVEIDNGAVAMTPDELVTSLNDVDQADGGIDKQFAVSVLRPAHDDPLRRLRVLAVERDATTGYVSPVATRSTGRVASLGSALFSTIHEAYAPMAVLVGLDGASVELEPRAAEFSPPDPASARIRSGTALLPFLRYFDREGTLLRVQPVPWTYLHADSVDGSTVRATILSGYRAPLGTRVGRRVQVVALAVRARRPATRVDLVERGQFSVPAAGVRVEVVRKTRPKDEPAGESLELLSDRRGTVVVPQDESGGFAWLYVRSGTAVIARVPLLPGSVDEMRLELPDDAPRLEVEGAIERLNARLIDAVAKRETLVRRIRILARDADWKNVDPLITQLDELPTIASLNDEIDRLHTGPLATARETGNARAAFQIEKLVTATRDRIRRFLDPENIVQLKADVEELRRLDAEDAKRFDVD